MRICVATSARTDSVSSDESGGNGVWLFEDGEADGAAMPHPTKCQDFLAWVKMSLIPPHLGRREGRLLKPYGLWQDELGYDHR